MKGVLFSAFLAALFLSTAFGSSRALAALSWAHQHPSMQSAFGGTSLIVAHFLEGGQETCSTAGKACYFVIYWGYWNGSGWAQLGEVSHSTDHNYPTSHGSRLAGQNYPANQHGASHTFDTHAEWPSHWISPCNQYLLPYVHAYDTNGTYLSQVNPGSWMYYTC